MPRRSKGGGRGGTRQGAPATAYPNRTDLNAPKTQPITTATGQPYGAATAQHAAQAAIPLPGPGAGLPAQSTPAAGPGAGTPGPATSPGGLGSIAAPSDMPQQPLTAGLTGGPGPGPEALAAPDPLVKAAAVLNTLGHNADPQTAALRARVNAMLANQGAA